MVRAKTITGHEICIQCNDDDSFDLCIIPAQGYTERDAGVEFATELKRAIEDGSMPARIRGQAEAIVEHFLGTGPEIFVNFDACSAILSAVHSGKTFN